jgi:hypothetical protein
MGQHGLLVLNQGKVQLQSYSTAPCTPLAGEQSAVLADSATRGQLET